MMEAAATDEASFMKDSEQVQFTVAKVWTDRYNTSKGNLLKVRAVNGADRRVPDEAEN